MSKFSDRTNRALHETITAAAEVFLRADTDAAMVGALQDGVIELISSVIADDKAHSAEPEATEGEITDVATAFQVLKAAMVADGPGVGGSLAGGLHDNITMACYDAIKTHDVMACDEDSGEMSHDDALQVGNDAAARFMARTFGISTWPRV